VGDFRIQSEAGKYTVSIIESGFKTLTQQVEVTSVEDQRFSFVLEIDRDIRDIGSVLYRDRLYAQNRNVQAFGPTSSISIPRCASAETAGAAPHCNSAFLSATGHQLGF
jgi:hypothetical protein